MLLMYSRIDADVEVEAKMVEEISLLMTVLSSPISRTFWRERREKVVLVGSVTHYVSLDNVTIHTTQNATLNDVREIMKRSC
jgi:hypothetical protein